MATNSFNVKENTTAKYTSVLKDEDDVVIGSGSLDTLTLTLYNQADGSIINSRNDQNVLNANNVTVDGSGNVTWILQPGDNPIVDSTLEYETHVALFKFTWSSGTKQGYHEVDLIVENFTKVT